MTLLLMSFHCVARFACAGRPKEIRYNSLSTNISLDARCSFFDPFGASLKYQWFKVDVDGAETAINTTSSEWLWFI